MKNFIWQLLLAILLLMLVPVGNGFCYYENEEEVLGVYNSVGWIDPEESFNWQDPCTDVSESHWSDGTIHWWWKCVTDYSGGMYVVTRYDWWYYPDPAPTNFSVERVSFKTVQLTWTSESNFSYNIYYSTNPGVSKTNYDGVIKGIDGSDYLHEELNQGQTYYYVIAAVDINGRVGYVSDEISIAMIDLTPIISLLLLD